MGQVPEAPRILLVGDGRLATHLHHFLLLLHRPPLRWARRADAEADLARLASTASHLWLAIHDAAIEPFLQTRPHLLRSGLCRVHFAGALHTPLAHGAHPLMTFTDGVYDLTTYRSIPFIVDPDAPADVLAGLPNPRYPLPPARRVRYHALCALACGGSALLWDHLLTAFEREFALPPATAHPIIRQLARNLIESPRTAFTGPLARGDRDAVAGHLRALADDPFGPVYAALADAFGTGRPPAQGGAS